MSTYGDTSGTTPDPETGAEGDTDQLTQDDTLLDRGVENVLDEGYSPPEHPPNPHRLETEFEQYQGENLDERLAQEEPEVWETADVPGGSGADPDRAGRLTPADPEASGFATTSVMAQDVGIAGSAATAEEAAVHVVDDEPLDTESLDDEPQDTRPDEENRA